MSVEHSNEDAVNEAIRYREVQEAIRDRSNLTKAHFAAAKRLQEKARAEKDAGRPDQAWALLAEASKRIEASPTADEIVQMVDRARQAHDRAEGKSNILRAEIQTLAAQRTLDFAPVFDELKEEDEWWLETRR